MSESWLWWAQLAADVLLLAAVVLLYLRPRGAGRPAPGQAPADMEGFLAEAGRLSKEFDRLLAEKRELVGSTLATLDGRIARLKEMAAELERSQRQAPPPPAPQPAAPPAPAAPSAEEALAGPAGRDPQSFRDQVRELSRQGQSAQQIAQATGRPRSEVELALSLGK
jgi:hypothetical protein